MTTIYEMIRDWTNTDVEISADPVPEVIEKYLKAQFKAPDREAELDAYREFCARYQAEKNQKRRIVFQQVLNWIVDTKTCGFVYGLGEMLDYVLKKERQVQKTIYPDDLYRIVGDPIASALHWKSINIQPGTSSNRKSGEIKGLRRRYADWTATEIDTMSIEIGKHELVLGEAVYGILKGLEQRYGIDFRKLEKEYQRKLRKTS